MFFLLTIYVGFLHAFEADHLLAVSNIVSRRNNTWISVKDGIFWGLGHSSTIFLVGIVMILFKVGIPEAYFHYFEATVGLMLIILAVYRLVKFFRTKKITFRTHKGDHKHIHVHMPKDNGQQVHALAYGVGLVHGLAGSGVLILFVMTQIKGTVDGLTYLLIFGTGCMAGMMVACGLFSIPFSKRLMERRTLRALLVITSSILCLLYGTKVIFENLLT